MTNEINTTARGYYHVTRDQKSQIQALKTRGMLNAPCYFVTPYHSWERGLNEHTNGLVRQYLPKKTNLKGMSREELSDIKNEINHRPRKVLGYKTPYEVFYQKFDPERVIV